MIVFPVLEYNNVPMLWHTLEVEYIEYRLLCRASIFLLHAPAACLWDCLHSQIRHCSLHSGRQTPSQG